jgi:acyl-CoA thioesterase
VSPTNPTSPAPFHRWAGLSVIRESPGEVDVALDVRPDHMNLAGVVHGGMLAAMADTATGLAVRTTLGPGQMQVTGQLNVHFLSPARGGRILGKGRVVKSGSRMAYAEADIVDEGGRLLARASATYFVVRDEASDASNAR